MKQNLFEYNYKFSYRILIRITFTLWFFCFHLNWFASFKPMKNVVIIFCPSNLPLIISSVARSITKRGIDYNNKLESIITLIILFPTQLWQFYEKNIWTLSSVQFQVSWAIYISDLFIGSKAGDFRGSSVFDSDQVLMDSNVHYPSCSFPSIP